jgi:hypothetical protein
VFEFSLSNPSAVDTTYTFTFTNGTAGSADYTTTSQTVTYLRVLLRNGIGKTTADTIAESMRPLLLSLEPLRLLEQSMIMMRPNCGTITPAGYEGSPAVFEFSLSNPSAVDNYTLHSPMELLEVDYTTTANSNVLRVLLRNCFGTNNCGYYCRINETFTMLLERLRLNNQW